MVCGGLLQRSQEGATTLWDGDDRSPAQAVFLLATQMLEVGEHLLLLFAFLWEHACFQVGVKVASKRSLDFGFGDLVWLILFQQSRLQCCNAESKC